jgi:small-conductance mechanosensitive channel
MENLQSILDQTLYNNTVRQWLIAAAIAIGVYIGLMILRTVLGKYLGKLVKKTTVAWDDALASLMPRTKWIFLLALALFAGSRVVELSVGLSRLISQGTVIIMLFQGGIWANTLVSFFVDRYRQARLKEDPASVTTISGVALLVRIGVWLIVVLLALANAGIQIAPLLAGLGVGGIAIALAVQTVLKDLLASLSIILDKPFVVGDFIIVGDLLGAVEYIGLKTTRIRSLSGEQLVFSNNDLLESRIRNFGRMRERRVAFKLGVTYQTPREKLAKVPGIIKAAIEAQQMTRFDRSHFNEYGNFSLNFETVFYVGTPDYNKWMDIQQAINLKIHEEFEKEGIEFAYPTQTIFMAPPTPQAS